MKISKMEVTRILSAGDDMTVVNAARVSFHKESKWDEAPTEGADGASRRVLPEGDTKLIRYLAKHKHYSPFNHAFLSYRVKAPIFVARQLVKHKFMPWNEVSRRYVDEEPEFYLPDEWRSKAENVKQGSSNQRCEAMYAVDEQEDEIFRGPSHDEWLRGIFMPDAVSMYKNMLSVGVAPEQARMVLPQNMMTEWIWSGTLGAFADMLSLRLDPHTQAESREIANMIYADALPLFPVSLPALIESK